jgi:glycosyltransferase involved in cell wall biosynthesis
VKLTVVMAVRNGEPHVRSAIESVLSQSIADYEFIIVDDGSTDATPQILLEYESRDSRIRVLRNLASVGPYAAANRALLQARADYIARHDADDTSPPDRFAIQLEQFESHPNVSLVTGAVELFHDVGKQTIVCRPPVWQPRLEWELLFTNAIGAGGHVMFPRVVRGVPVLFQTRHLYAEDYGLWCQLIHLGTVVCPVEVVYRYRQHAASITSRKKADQDDCLSRIRLDYQLRYLQPGVSRGLADRISRFWTLQGVGPLGPDVPLINASLAELRANFLAYLERRYGARDRMVLDGQIEAILMERLGYWLYASVKSSDRQALSDLAAFVSARRQTIRVATKACRYAAAAIAKKLKP